MPENSGASSQPDPSQGHASLPFFTRFLEGQNDAERHAATTKYPSDRDEWTTNKYPSDGDDDPPPVDGVLSASTERQASPPQTLKYPSDWDEVVTMKYPSDGDDDPPAEDSVMRADSGTQSGFMTLKYPSDRDEWDPIADV